MDEQTTPGAADPGTPPATGAASSGGVNSAEAAAADALKAVQRAVSDLAGSGASKGSGAATPAAVAGGQAGGSAESDAAMAAAIAAINQAKSVNAVGVTNPASIAGGNPSPLSMPSFVMQSQTKVPEGMDLLADVNLQVKIELGRTRMLVEDVLRLGEGSVVELDKLAGDPVDVYVNDRHVAKGEVLVLNDNFCVRINEIVAQVHTPG